MAAQFVFEQAPFASCHASTLVEAAPGRLLCAWFAGAREGADDVAIWMSHFDGNWSPPEKVAAEPGRPCWNPVLFQPRGDAPLHLYYKAGPSPETWSGFVQYSQDEGQTFGPAELMPAGLLGPIKNKPIQLADGAILAPTSVESYRAWACWVDRSVDGGKTWTRHGPIDHPTHAEGVIQPSILQRADGSLLALMRSTRRIGQICRSESVDLGQTWTRAEAHPDLPNPNSGLDAVTLADGRHALVHNPTHLGRTPLILSISDDDGQSWRPSQTLESGLGEFSYPAVIQAGDGTVHVSYTWKRRRIRHHAFAAHDLRPD